MARERRYLFDTTPLFSLPPCGGGLGRGVSGGVCATQKMPPPDARSASTSPASGGGEEWRGRQ